jgi:non-ribosomal peptide synthetase component F
LLLSAAATARLQELARTRRLTLSTLIQGTWALLLSRYGGNDDVLFGVTISGRPPELAGVESMIGMFINVLPLRVSIREEASLCEWLGQLQENVFELRPNEHVPLSKIQSWTAIGAGRPLFESIVTVQNLPFARALEEHAERLGIEEIRDIERAHYPLAVTVRPGSSLELRINFDPNRFETNVISRILGQFAGLLGAMVENPEQTLAELPWVSEREQELLIDDWNRSPEERVPDDADLELLSEDELDSLIDGYR